MSATGLDAFDRSIHETNAYLKAVMSALGTEDRHLALGALRGGLHALRDVLDSATMAHLTAQLPMLLRGLFFEDWSGRTLPLHARSPDEFLDLVERHLPPQLQRYPEEAARAVFAALAERIEAGEADKLFRSLPRAARALWPHSDRRILKGPKRAS